MLETIVAVVGALVAGAVVALKVIAPKTATKKDDEILALLQKVLPYLPAGTDARAAVVAKLPAKV